MDGLRAEKLPGPHNGNRDMEGTSLASRWRLIYGNEPVIR